MPSIFAYSVKYKMNMLLAAAAYLNLNAFYQYPFYLHKYKKIMANNALVDVDNS